MCLELPSTEPPKEGNCSEKSLKIHRAKIQKRTIDPTPLIIDDMELLETPIQVVKEGNDRALVASTNKPPKTL